MSTDFRMSMRAVFKQSGNRLRFFLEKLPGVGKSIANSLDDKERTPLFLLIMGNICSLVLDIIVRFAIIGFFVLLPMYIFSKVMPEGKNAFELQNCLVYFTLVMVCFCGSMVNSAIFKETELSYIFLRQLNVRPSEYFKSRLLRRTFKETIAYFVVFFVFGMEPLKALYLVCVIDISRYAGETFNILFFRITGHKVEEFRGLNVVIMLFSLFLAYFVSYLRGCVPDAGHLIFKTSWLLVILLVGAFLIYYVWNYTGYSKIARKIFTRTELMQTGSVRELSEASIDDKNRIAGRTLNGKYGYAFLNSLFFSRIGKNLASGIVVRMVFIIVLIAVGIVAYFNGYGNIVEKAIAYSPALLIIIMYVFSNGKKLSRFFFRYCDSGMLRNVYYKNKRTVAWNFFIRLRYAVGIDMIVGFGMIAMYVILSVVMHIDILAVLPICIEIFLLTIFFALYNLFIYYMFQPYSLLEDSSKISYVIFRVLMYILALGCIYINASGIMLTLGIALVLCVFSMVAITCVRCFAGHTFKLR